MLYVVTQHGVDKPVHASAGPKPGEKRRVIVWCQLAVKTLWHKSTMTGNQMLSVSARMSPVRDPQQSRLTATSDRSYLRTIND